MEKRRCVKTDEITVNMLVHALRDVFREEKDAGASTKETGVLILDEDRKINAQKFESAFYAKPDLRAVRPPEEPREPAPATLDLETLVEQLRQSPELANTLAALLSAAPGGR